MPRGAVPRHSQTTLSDILFLTGAWGLNPPLPQGGGVIGGSSRAALGGRCRCTWRPRRTPRTTRPSSLSAPTASTPSRSGRRPRDPTLGAVSWAISWMCHFGPFCISGIYPLPNTISSRASRPNVRDGGGFAPCPPPTSEGAVGGRGRIPQFLTDGTISDRI